ncbi:unnamed protein product, partial [Prorocentrum cordatum]
GYVECNPDGWVQMSDLLKAEILEGVSRETIDRVIIDSNAKKLRRPREGRRRGAHDSAAATGGGQVLDARPGPAALLVWLRIRV